MAAPITFQLDFKGLAEARKGLQEILTLLKEIAAVQGLLNLGAAGGRRGAGGVFPLSPAETAAAAGLGAGLGAKPYGFTKEFEKFFREAAQQGKNIAGAGSNVPPDQLGRTFQIGQMAKSYSKEIAAFLAGKGGNPFKRGFGTIGAEIGGGAAAWADKGPFGFLKKVIDKLIETFGGLIIKAFGVYEALKKLLEGIQHAAEAFQLAARQALPVGESVALMNAMKAIGISGGATERMLAQAEFNRRSQRVGISGTEAMIGAARVSGFADIQQLTNMSKEFTLAMILGKDNAREMEKASGINLINSILWNQLTSEFKTLLSQLAAALGPIITLMELWAMTLLKAINYFLEMIIWLEDHIPGLKTLMDIRPGTEHIPFGTGEGGGHSNAWGGMGFWIGGGPDQVLNEIAEHTKETARNTRKGPKGDGEWGKMDFERYMQRWALPGFP